MALPIYDDHLHLSPSGRNIEALKEFKAEGGTGLTLVNLPYPEVQIADGEDFRKAYDITVKMPNVHGAPVHMGPAEEVGVADVMKPDYGDAVDIYEGEIPVFWPCGVTPQAAVENAKPPIAITHAPGHMFITDIINAELNDFLEAKKNK